MVLVGDREENNQTPALPVDDLNLLLAEQQRSLRVKFVEMEKMFPETGGLISFHEARTIVALQNARRIAQHYSDGVEYVEFLLRKQLVAAIGKELRSADFSEYMVGGRRRREEEEGRRKKKKEKS